MISFMDNPYYYIVLLLFFGVRLSLIYDAIEAGRNAFGTEKRDVIWALSLYVTTKHVMSLF